MKNLAIAITTIALAAGFNTAHVGGGAAGETASSVPQFTTKAADPPTSVRRWRLPKSADTTTVTVRPRILTKGERLRRTVVLQRRVPGESWQRVLKKKTSQRGRVRVVLKPLDVGTTEFRLRVRGTKKYAPRKSRVLRLGAAPTGQAPNEKDPGTAVPGGSNPAEPGSPTGPGTSDPGIPPTPGIPDTESPLDLCGATAQHSVAGYVTDGALDEISGLAASRRSENRYWVHNDSGDGPHLYAINASGSLRQTVSLSGVTPRDWEDLASGPGPNASEPYLYVADFGDNHRVRSTITIYRIKEPAVGSGSSSTSVYDSLTLTYPDGPHNAEALLVDPWDGSLLIVTKEAGATAQLFSTGSFGAGSHSRTLQHRGQTNISEIATGGDVSPNGRSIIVRGYGGVHGWTRSAGESLWSALQGSRCSLASVGEPQGEAVAFTADGKGYLTISEKSGAAVNLFTLR